MFNILVFIFAFGILVDGKAITKNAKPIGNCKHIYPTIDEIPHPILLESSKITKREAEHQLRIDIFYDASVEKLEDDKKSVVKQVVPDAVHFWENALKIRRSDGPIKINQKCQNNQYFLSDNDPHQYCKEACIPTNCGEVVVPAEHLEACRTCDADGLKCDKVKDSGSGLKNADFILYVSAKPTPQCGETIGNEADTVAYAAHCQQEAEMDRPIAGHTNICPQAIINGTKEISGLYSTIKHELLHALGFSSSLFAFYRDADGKPRTPRGDDGKPAINYQLQVRQWSEDTIKEVKRPYKVRSGIVERTFHLMVTPKVLEEVRSHFGCPTLEGAELEDQGGDGTFLTHWEKRLFQNEAMTGTVHTQDPIYSRLTLALLEDSGWYLPNYDMAEEIHWGRGMGCDFATLSCKEIMDRSLKPRSSDPTTLQSPFCNTLMSSTTKTSCTQDRTSVGNCNLVEYGEDLPEIYQNFDHVEGVSKKDIGKVGGSVSLADFCPYVQEFTWKSDESGTSSRGSQCLDAANSPEPGNNFSLEDYGEGSLCFEQGSAWQQRSCTMLKQFRRYGSGCYRYKCEDGLVKIIIMSNLTYTCFEEGQTIEVSRKNGDWLHEGSIVCPSCEEICGSESCSSQGSNEQFEMENNLLKQDISEDCSLADSNNSLIKDFLQSFNFNIPE